MSLSARKGVEKSSPEKGVFGRVLILLHRPSFIPARRRPPLRPIGATPGGRCFGRSPVGVTASRCAGTLAQQAARRLAQAASVSAEQAKRQACPSNRQPNHLAG